MTPFQEKYMSYVVWDDKNIKGFFGENYRFLSNFHPAEIWFEGQFYINSENAYQASKIESKYRHLFSSIKPSLSKKDWKNYPLIDKTAEDWNNRKYDVMSVILFDKFYRNLDLRKKLLDTGDKYLEETNHWHDNFYGNCICDKCGYKGNNNLGKILMKIRSYWS